MAKRVHDLAVHVRDTYGGDAARYAGADAADSGALRANLAALPGFGEMKLKALGAVLAKRFGVEAAEDLVAHPDARRRRLHTGAGRLPGLQAGPQGRIVPRPGPRVKKSRTLSISRGPVRRVGRATRNEEETQCESW